MTTFYPGPSKVYPQVATYLQDAMNEGILSQNHRSKAFMEMLEVCILVFKQKKNIPDDYEVYFTSSATECWEIISQSLVRHHSHHVFNGAFGEKWFEYASRLSKETSATNFDFQEKISESLSTDADVWCFTQNETSNATQIEFSFFNKLNSEALIAVDVTSSLGGIELDWKSGDIWLASVQKCLGLPAGMGVMICSPKAIKRAEEIGERNHYNSLLFIRDNFKKFQTHYTPNILGIYLLMRVMQQVPDIQAIDTHIKSRAKDFYRFIAQETTLDLLITNEEVRSETVIAIKGTVDEISVLKQKAKENNIILGNGYGAWKDTTFRIANFPAIEDWEFDKLKTLLRQ
ncbi:phosphoserine aminotransferase [Emticicia aquatilis]|uniref:phosphoserine transaminase n=1 Tax=Emticicia aquatilis TaxID=1537369 RepID=A0A916YRL4_9BACT|nr:aminotransferase class V-fold PLP-dependent enzyme [Emticicia aquatilis]GGD57725.1 phosphoserine aminotransferase [Emticicia aquatilis]